MRVVCGHGKAHCLGGLASGGLAPKPPGSRLQSVAATVVSLDREGRVLGTDILSPVIPSCLRFEAVVTTRGRFCACHIASCLMSPKIGRGLFSMVFLLWRPCLLRLVEFRSSGHTYMPESSMELGAFRLQYTAVTFICPCVWRLGC